MVERINQPEAPPAYRILPAKEAKDDESRRQQYEEGEEKYQKALPKDEWSKYKGRTVTIRPAKIEIAKISKILFKRVSMRGGMGILETTIVYKDGRTTDTVLILIPKTEDYVKLRILKRGAIVPDSFWNKGNELEVGIVFEESPSGSYRQFEEKALAPKVAKRNRLTETLGLMKNGRPEWFTIIIYLTAILAISLIISYAI